jgi:hypothetical protein
MAFIREEHILQRHPAPLQAVDHLFRLDHWHVRVVGAVEYERRRHHTVEHVDGRQAAQRLGLGIGVAVAVCVTL